MRRNEDLVLERKWSKSNIRAIYKKGFLEWLLEEKPDVLCLQEVRAIAVTESDHCPLGIDVNPE